MIKDQRQAAREVRTFIWARQKTRPHREDFIHLSAADLSALNSLLRLYEEPLPEEVAKKPVDSRGMVEALFIGGPDHRKRDMVPLDKDFIERPGTEHPDGLWPMTDGSTDRVLYRRHGERKGLMVYRIDGQPRVITEAHINGPAYDVDHVFCPHGKDAKWCAQCFEEGRTCIHRIPLVECVVCGANLCPHGKKPDECTSCAEVDKKKQRAERVAARGRRNG